MVQSPAPRGTVAFYSAGGKAPTGNGYNTGKIGDLYGCGAVLSSVVADLTVVVPSPAPYCAIAFQCAAMVSIRRYFNDIGKVWDIDGNEAILR